jgi:hypothetical protein
MVDRALSQVRQPALNLWARQQLALKLLSINVGPIH